MQRISVLALVLLAGACSSPTARRQLAAKADGDQPITRPIFAARALTTPDQRAHILERNPVLDTGKFDAALEALYEQIDPEKSLFIHDCADWCDDLFYSFSTWLTQAASIVDSAHPDIVIAQWKQSASDTIPGGVPLDQLRLQAVVNRLDFATVRADGMYENAELRFVYAPLPAATTDFRLILEFVLPALDLKGLAMQWTALSALSGGQFSKQLKDLIAALKTNGFQDARLRTNSKSTGASTWFLAQWDFRLGQSLSQPAPLTDMVRQCCLSDPTGAANAKCANYGKVWDELGSAIASSTGPPPESWPIKYLELLSPPVNYDDGESFNTRPSMPIPAGLTSPSGAARDVLALQQCSFCHGAETHTDFVHVVSRIGASTKSGLSCFLSGPGGANTKPTFQQLKDLDPSVVCPVQLEFNAPAGVNYQGLTVKPCPNNGDGEMCETRGFNDLARRATFMAGALLRPAVPGPALDDQFRIFRRALIESYGTHMTH